MSTPSITGGYTSGDDTDLGYSTSAASTRAGGGDLKVQPTSSLLWLTSWFTPSKVTVQISDAPTTEVGTSTLPTSFEEFEEEEDNYAEKQRSDEQSSWFSWIVGFFWDRGPIVSPTLYSSHKLLAKSVRYGRDKVARWRESADIRRLTPDCEAYLTILQYVNNSRKDRNLGVQQIYKVARKNEKEFFFPIINLHRLLLWHQVESRRHLSALIENGFSQKSSDQSPYIFTDRIAEVQGFSGVPKRLLFVLAEVAPGHVYASRHYGSPYWTVPEGYDSVMRVGNHVPNPRYEKIYGDAIVPCGPTMRSAGTKKGDEVKHNEYLIFDDRAILRFIVECRVY